MRLNPRKLVFASSKRYPYPGRGEAATVNAVVAVTLVVWAAILKQLAPTLGEFVGLVAELGGAIG